MNTMESVINGIVAKFPNEVTEGHIGEDGLMYCSKCNTKKQTRIELFGKEKTVPCMCKCEAEALRKEKEEKERQEYERRIDRYRKTAGFNDKAMESWTFENDDGLNPKITEAMKNYVKNFPELKKNGIGLLLWGSVGTGKTYAASCVVNALIDEGYPCMITSFTRIVNNLQGMFEGKQEYLDRLNTFPLLVLDDLGVERKSEYMKEQVFNIIDSRYRMNLPIIVTTNMNIDEIKSMANIDNTRIYDRILEKCHPIEMNGVSRRRKIVRDRYAEMNKLLGLE